MSSFLAILANLCKGITSFVGLGVVGLFLFCKISKSEVFDFVDFVDLTLVGEREVFVGWCGIGFDDGLWHFFRGVFGGGDGESGAEFAGDVFDAGIDWDLGSFRGGTEFFKFAGAGEDAGFE